MASTEAADSLRDEQIGFERLAAHHRANKRGYFLYATALVVLGTALALMGLVGLMAQLPALIVGIVAILVAVFPYLESVEHRERSDGLAVLHDHFINDHASAASTDHERDELMAMILKFYQHALKNT